MASHVYFDFFGTLVDYDAGVHLPDHNVPWEYCRGAGVPIEASDAAWAEAWRVLDAHAETSGIEVSMGEIATRFAAAVGVEGDLSALVRDYLDAWSTAITPADGVLECLEDLARDHRIAIVSNTHSPVLVPMLAQRFGLDAVIPDVFTSVEIGWRKPRREIFEHVLAADGVAASDAVFVGDNPVADVAGPRAVGMTAFRIVRAGDPSPDGVTLRDLPGWVRALGSRTQ